MIGERFEMYLFLFQLTIAVLSGRIAVYSCNGAAEVIGTDSYAANGIVHTVDALF